jgi:hypothetical protein
MRHHHSPLYSADQKEMPALEARKTVTRGRNVMTFARYFVSYRRPGISRSQRVSRAASGFRAHHPGCVLRAMVQRGRHGLLHGRRYGSRFTFGAGSKSVRINTAGFRKKKAPCTECQYTSNAVAMTMRSCICRVSYSSLRATHCRDHPTYGSAVA